MKIKVCNNLLDLEKANSILLIGKCGTGKTRTIKEILRQAMRDYSKLDVFYVDEHEADCKEVKEIVGDSSLNKICVLIEPELKSLYDVVKAQQDFRNQLICESGVNTLTELVGKTIRVYKLRNRICMPDDIIWYYEDGQQKWLLAHEYYDRIVENRNTCFIREYYDRNIENRSTCFVQDEYFGEYNPSRLILCFDEFYTLDMSEEGQKLVHDIALSVIRFGRVAYQNVILTTQRLSQHKEYSDIYNLASVKAFFHSGLDNEDDYRVLFNKELPIHIHRGCVTVESLDTKPIYDNGTVSKLYDAMDEILVGHELEDFSLTDIKMLSQILKCKVIYLDKIFKKRILHIIEVTKELDFSDCKDMNMSWHIMGQDVTVSILIHQLPSDYAISAKMLNMSDEDLIENKDLCKYIG